MFWDFKLSFEVAILIFFPLSPKIRRNFIQFSGHTALITFVNNFQVNLDLMYALPQQTLDEAIDDAKTATSFNTQHLSFYHLTIEPNTFFFKHPPKLPLDDESAVMQETIEDILSQHGYEHYETSAFAKPKSQCQHNLNYWQFGDYLGIGAGAHSKLTFHDKMIRESRYKNPRQYMEHIKMQNRKFDKQLFENSSSESDNEKKEVKDKYRRN
jgi:coproporphyrinogen III oxidase-like Fe-S oxidoreductase